MVVMNIIIIIIDRNGWYFKNKDDYENKLTTGYIQ